METVPRDDLLRIEAAMREIVAKDMPIRSLSLSYGEAIEYFEKHNQPDTLLLLKNRNDPAIAVHSCDGFLDLSHGPLVPSTGVLSVFALLGYPPGFLLRYPPRDNPMHLGQFVENPVLFSIYREYKNWGKILRVGSVGRLDELIREGGIQEFIQVAEALQDKKIAEIADRINEKRDEVKLVLIAGPSSSGKTTFSKKLTIQLRVVGRNPVTISLDDYFKPQSLTPKDEEGKPDFESIDALDVELLNDEPRAPAEERGDRNTRLRFPRGSAQANGQANEASRSRHPHPRGHSRAERRADSAGGETKQAQDLCLRAHAAQPRRPQQDRHNGQPAHPEDGA